MKNSWHCSPHACAVSLSSAPILPPLYLRSTRTADVHTYVRSFSPLIPTPFIPCNHSVVLYLQIIFFHQSTSGASSVRSLFPNGESFGQAQMQRSRRDPLWYRCLVKQPERPVVGSYWQSKGGPHTKMNARVYPASPGTIVEGEHTNYIHEFPKGTKFGPVLEVFEGQRHTAVKINFPAGSNGIGWVNVWKWKWEEVGLMIAYPTAAPEGHPPPDGHCGNDVVPSDGTGGGGGGAPDMTSTGVGSSTKGPEEVPTGSHAEGPTQSSISSCIENIPCVVQSQVVINGCSKSGAFDGNVGETCPEATPIPVPSPPGIWKVPRPMGSTACEGEADQTVEWGSYADAEAKEAESGRPPTGELDPAKGCDLQRRSVAVADASDRVCVSPGPSAFSGESVSSKRDATPEIRARAERGQCAAAAVTAALLRQAEPAAEQAAAPKALQLQQLAADGRSLRSQEWNDTRSLEDSEDWRHDWSHDWWRDPRAAPRAAAMQPRERRDRLAYEKWMQEQVRKFMNGPLSYESYMREWNQSFQQN